MGVTYIKLVKAVAGIKMSHASSISVWIRQRKGMRKFVRPSEWVFDAGTLSSEQVEALHQLFFGHGSKMPNFKQACLEANK
jgi:hypothetical protein